ncbi:tetratricopeptide repeat protein [Streptomyces sp. LP11]|uniref:Tetratricopeptide repeat protein n=1 Tax=Streptomyces pyxinicus TaxID=2970331 RepID=A0ABT2B3M1_9ACTN|nr:tetratricopeptide repeat protein [Streptomyces sp. LP11]MCS0603101.1 tetratricopeptide repeat protein [Streptomyces sp. LP11]
MLEIVALSALTTFLMSVGNGAAGEMGKQLLVSTGALARRTLGGRTPLPATAEGWEALAGQMHARLGHDPRQAAEWALLVGSSSPPPASLVPTAGLPPAPRDFTDRQGVLKQLKGELTRPAAGRPRVALLYGPPGIGTTATALHLGAVHQGLFPDGQFYVDLRDGGGGPGVAPAAVLGRLLRAMGVAAERIPAPAGREDLYRRLTTGRRALIVIDHVTSMAQVRSLIPATPEVFLLVVVSGRPFLLEAERVAVPPLSDRYALRMLRNLAGREKVAGARARLPEVLRSCAGNAYALRTEAARLLADEPGPPGHPAGDGPPPEHPVHAAARTACRALPPETVRLCRLTALGGWPSVDARLAATAVGVEDVSEATRMLEEAVAVRLVEPLPADRYSFRPEVRRYLADSAGVEHGVAECAAAVARTLDALLNRVLHAAHAVLPQSWRTEPAPERGAACRDEAQGVAVLAAEVGNVVRAVTVAEEHGHLDTALRLARALWPLQLKAGHWDEVLPALHAATRCADRHRPDSRMAGALHFQLAHCLGELGRGEDADRAASAAVACERAAGHRRGEASAVELRGLLLLHRWEWEAAYERFTEAEAVYGEIISGQEGARDLPRALALVERHQGRALRGMGRFEESRRLLETAVAFFAAQGEGYNQARALTDLAETLHEEGDNARALDRITEAERLLPAAAVPHRQYLAGLRLRCETGRQEA